MESNRTQTITDERDIFQFANSIGNSNDVETRLNTLLAIQRENDLEKSRYKTEQERFEASLVKNPLSTEKSFAWFGLMLGAFPPLALFSKFFLTSNIRFEESWVIFLLFFVNVICATVGYFSGKLISKMVAEVEKYSWSMMLLILPFIGILWGIMAGGAGGVFIFVIGAVFGAIIAAMVGGIALPVFTIFHRLLKKGDVIERDQFLPIALGITFVISAIFVGLDIK